MASMDGASSNVASTDGDGVFFFQLPFYSELPFKNLLLLLPAGAPCDDDGSSFSSSSMVLLVVTVIAAVASDGRRG